MTPFQIVVLGTIAYGTWLFEPPVLAPPPQIAADVDREEDVREVVKPFEDFVYRLKAWPDAEQRAALRAAFEQSDGASPALSYWMARMVFRNQLEGATHEEGRAYLQSAADAGYPPAMTYVAVAQITGNVSGILTAEEAGRALLHKAYAKGDPEAALQFGIGTKAGTHGFTLDLAASERYLEEALAGGHLRARFPLADTQIRLGKTELAFVNMDMAAEEGDISARRSLAKCLRTGLHVPADHERAVVLLEKWRSEPDGELLRMLGEAYLEGYGNPENGRAVVLVFHQAAELGNEEAALKLVDLYFDGLLEWPPTPELGVKTLELLADAGSAEASFRLARLCLEGVYVPRDAEKAQALLRAAADKDHRQAKLYLQQLNGPDGGLLRSDGLPRVGLEVAG